MHVLFKDVNNTGELTDIEHIPSDKIGMAITLQPEEKIHMIVTYNSF